MEVEIVNDCEIQYLSEREIQYLSELDERMTGFERILLLKLKISGGEI